MSGIIPSISGISGIAASTTTTNPVAPSSTTGPSFSSFLQNALDETNQLSSTADQVAQTYAAGGPVTVDQLMVAEQQATLALDTVVQVRDRAVSAYQSIMDMQV